MSISLDELNERKDVIKEMKRRIAPFLPLIAFHDSGLLVNENDKSLFGCTAAFGGDGVLPTFRFSVLGHSIMSGKGAKFVKFRYLIEPASSANPGTQIIPGGRKSALLAHFDKWLNIVRGYASGVLDVESEQSIEIYKSFSNEHDDRYFTTEEQQLLSDFLMNTRSKIVNDLRDSSDETITKALSEEMDEIRNTLPNLTIGQFKERFSRLIATILRIKPRTGLALLVMAEEFLYQKGFDAIWNHLPQLIESIKTLLSSLLR